MKKVLQPRGDISIWFVSKSILDENIMKHVV